MRVVAARRPRGPVCRRSPKLGDTAGIAAGRSTGEWIGTAQPNWGRTTYAGTVPVAEFVAEEKAGRIPAA